MGFVEILCRKECLGRHGCGPCLTSLHLPVLSPHRGKEVACLTPLSRVCPGWGSSSQSLWEEFRILERQGIPGAPQWQGSGSVLVPSLAGAVRVVHGQWMGLCVEHPVFQRESVIFREQKIEVSAARRRGARCSCQCWEKVGLGPSGPMAKAGAGT